MIYDNTPLGNDLFQVPIRHRAADVEEDCEQDHLLWKVRTFERDNLASSEWSSGRLEPAILQVTRVKKQCLRQNPFKHPRQFRPGGSEAHRLNSILPRPMEKARPH